MYETSSAFNRKLIEEFASARQEEELVQIEGNHPLASSGAAYP